MPVVFVQEGYKFFFYSNEHRPIHVHVRHGDGEAVFVLKDGVELREAYGMKVRELAASRGTGYGAARAYYSDMA